MLTTIQQFLQWHPFAELGAILLLVIGLSYLMKIAKQPLMIGYIIAGFLVSPHILWFLQDSDGVQMFSHLGVALLLFMVGIGLNPREIKETGKVSLLIWWVQILLTIIIWSAVAMLLWYDVITSCFIGLVLSFSSTIIIVKLLGDKWLLDELFGKISIGILIVQDMIAMLVLVILSSLPTTWVEVYRWEFALVLFLKLLLVMWVTYLITRYILPHVLAFVAQSQEFLLIFAIGWCLICAATMEAIGFSLEIWALIAGLTIASLPYRFEIASKTKPLRDFFVVLFFVSLGSQIDLSSIGSSRYTIVVLSLFVLLIKPLLIMLPMKFLHYKPKTIFLTSTTLGQVSEFSFILMSLLLTMWYVTDITLVSIMTIVGLLSIAWSSYYINYSDYLYNYCAPYLKRLDSTTTSIDELPHAQEQYDIIIFGNHRTGKSIVDMLVKNKKKFIIVDYDPQVIKSLEQTWLPCRYGDASDIQLLEELHLDKAKMIVSTIHDYETNALILHQTKKITTGIITIMSASRVSDAESLYEWWASYVIVPHMIGWHHTAMLIEQYEYDIEKYAQKKMEEYNLLG